MTPGPGPPRPDVSVGAVAGGRAPTPASPLGQAAPSGAQTERAADQTGRRPKTCTLSQSRADRPKRIRRNSGSN